MSSPQDPGVPQPDIHPPGDPDPIPAPNPEPLPDDPEIAPPAPL